MVLRKQQALSGFTLIELSVALLILALIVGGVIVGQSMIRSSQVQSIVIDEAKYVEAARQFKEKYGYPPGDFPNATQYWGTNTWGWQGPNTGNTCPAAYNFTTPQTATCNGNGDGHIDAGGDSSGGSVQFYETWHAWQHLADAGYIEGQYTGANGASCWTQDVPGINEPATKLPGGGFEWNMFNGTVDVYTPGWYAGMKYLTQYMLIGGPSSNTCSPDVEPILTSSEALNIDRKVDDGMPATGKWIAGNVNGWCETSSTPPTYSISSGSWWNGTFSPTTATCSFAVEVDW